MDTIVPACEIKSEHSKQFEFSKSAYKDCYLILFFHTRYKSSTKNGIMNGNENSLIIYSPKDNVYHTSSDDCQIGFVNDWLYVRKEVIEEYIKKYNIAVNTQIDLYQPEFVTHTISKIMFEKYNENMYSEDKIKNLFVNMLIDVARASVKLSSSSKINSRISFYDKREYVFKNFSKRWTLNEMADIYGYSVSRFTSLYRSYFGISPIDDLNKYRLNIARSMLLSNMQSIKEIAYYCGFSTENYFQELSRNATVIPRNL